MSSRPGPDRARLRAALQAFVGPDGVLTEPDELLVYESDGLTIFRATADAVAFPRNTAEVAACVRDVSDAREYRLIETLASAVADELAERFHAERVRVRVRKPGISPAGLTVAYSAATAERGQ